MSEMKVIGKIKDNEYICTVTHAEIERYLNLYYNKMKRLEIGDVVDLADGYDFCRDTVSACQKTEEFIKSNQKVIEAIMSGISVISRYKPEDNE
jgi:hypothetical protein